MLPAGDKDVSEDKDRNGTSGDEGGEAKARVPVAVALRHEMAGKRAPKVVASGRGAIAEQILQIAFAHDIKVREDADLAELLSAIDIDSDIPAEAFAAVAEILVYVYRANRAMASPVADDGEETGEALGEETGESEPGAPGELEP